MFNGGYYVGVNIRNIRSRFNKKKDFLKFYINALFLSEGIRGGIRFNYSEDYLSKDFHMKLNTKGLMFFFIF